jgi:hypothetical protein
MGYFQDTRICEEHGFVLTPEGTCIRCVTDGARRARLRRGAKIATGATVVVAALMGITVARARVSTVEAPPVAPITLVAAPPPVASPPVAVVAREPTPQPSQDWDQAMARAEAERQRVAALQAAAEKQREVAAMTIPAPPVETYAPPREDPPAGEATDPAFAQTYGRPRTYYRSRGVGPRSGAGSSLNNPSAWGLPANNGGNFRNRTGGH